jgi:phage terminase small subunit
MAGSMKGNGKKATLTPKQERFAHEYVKDLNATQAAKRAGFSKATAYSAGQRLLKNVEIGRLVASLKEKQIAKSGLSAQMVLDELTKLGFSNVRDLFDAQGDLRSIHDLTPAQSACIASVEVVMKNATAGDGKVDRVLKIRTWDKPKVLELLAKHFALLTEVVKHTTDDKRVARLLAGRKRAAAK